MEMVFPDGGGQDNPLCQKEKNMTLEWFEEHNKFPSF